MSSMRSFDEALAAVRDVDGWMSPDQAERLYHAAAGTHSGDTIVEMWDCWDALALLHWAIAQERSP